MTTERIETCPHCNRPLVEPEEASDEPLEESTNRAALLDDDEVRQSVLDSIEAGNRPLVAAAQAGVKQSTWYKWLAKGKDQRARKVRGKYRQLLDDIEAAELRAEGRAVDIISNGAIDDPRLAMDFLKLRFHKDWQQSVAVVVKSERDTILEALLNEFTGEEDQPTLARFFGALAGVVGPRAAPKVLPEAGGVVDGAVVAEAGAGGPARLDSPDEPDVGGTASPRTAGEGAPEHRKG